MLERGVEVSDETIRLWTLKFGAEYARREAMCKRFGEWQTITGTAPEISTQLQ
jgi:transposase-like protein